MLGLASAVREANRCRAVDVRAQTVGGQYKAFCVVVGKKAIALSGGNKRLRAGGEGGFGYQSLPGQSPPLSSWLPDMRTNYRSGLWYQIHIRGLKSALTLLFLSNPSSSTLHFVQGQVFFQCRAPAWTRQLNNIAFRPQPTADPTPFSTEKWALMAKSRSSTGPAKRMMTH